MCVCRQLHVLNTLERSLFLVVLGKKVRLQAHPQTLKEKPKEVAIRKCGEFAEKHLTHTTKTSWVTERPLPTALPKQQVQSI